jgi:hypothetical protein
VTGECERGEEINAKNNPRPVTQTATSLRRSSDLTVWLTESLDLAPRSSGNQNCGFQGLCVAAVTPFVV